MTCCLVQLRTLPAPACLTRRLGRAAARPLLANQGPAGLRARAHSDGGRLLG